MTKSAKSAGICPCATAGLSVFGFKVSPP